MTGHATAGECSEPAIHIVVNGKSREIPRGTTVARLLELLARDARRVAVEVNGQLVPRISHESHRLNDGDEVEVVGFVGGG